jgi:hypothetical protein
MILIDALYVKSHGGLNVLFELLKHIPKNTKLDILLDHSVKKLNPFQNSWNIIYCNSSIINKTYFCNRKKYDKIFSVGNFPGLVFYKTHLLVYNMQYFLFNRDSIKGKLKLLWTIKSFIIRILFYLTNPELLVQSEWMKILALKSKIKFSNVKVFPIYKELKSSSENLGKNWIYVTSNQSYKNVKNVITAWMGSSESKLNKLYITVNGDDYLKATDHNVVFLGSLNHPDLQKFIVNQRPFFIQASEVESFGLNVIESSMLMLPIATLKKPYLKSTIKDYTSFKNWDELTLLFDNKSSIKIPKIIINNESKLLAKYLLK